MRTLVHKGADLRIRFLKYSPSDHRARFLDSDPLFSAVSDEDSEVVKFYLREA